MAPRVATRTAASSDAAAARGSIVLVTGPMFAGKSDHLVLLMNRYHHCKQRVALFAPRCSVRSSDGAFASRDGLRPPTATATFLIEQHELRAACAARVAQFDVFVLDEAQFFTELLPVARALRAKGKHVVAAGLALNWKREPFGQMFDLQRFADYCVQLTAVCTDCAQPCATLSFNVNGDAAMQSTSAERPSDVLIGDAEAGYVALCQRCYDLRRPDELPLAL